MNGKRGIQQEKSCTITPCELSLLLSLAQLARLEACLFWKSVSQHSDAVSSDVREIAVICGIEKWVGGGRVGRGGLNVFQLEECISLYLSNGTVILLIELTECVQ